MPTVSPPPQASPAEAGNGAPQAEIGYQEFVDRRIGETRTAVKTADMAAGFAKLIAGVLAYLLAAALAEHWLVTGGYSPAERLGLFGVGAIGVLVYVTGRIAPNLFRRVNPLYAAREIEKDSPALKNSLVNLLQLRSGDSREAVRSTLEQQAAERLASTGETAVDRAPLVRAAWLILGLVTVIGVYVVASPKDFFASAGRVLLPWATISAPTRVQIDDVQPGALEAAQGERLTITAMVVGLEQDEPVEIVFSTTDGRIVNRRSVMRSSETGLLHSVQLPIGSGAEVALGLQNDLTYRIEAGDAHTPNYPITVLHSPTIAPSKVRYEYPRYTGYSPREVEAGGDLRAIEGTRVTLLAEANLPIDSAQIDLRADGRPDVRMSVDERQATGEFILRRSADTRGNEVSNYVLRFTSIDGQANNSPPTYRIETIADLPPEAAVLEPAEQTLQVEADATITVGVEARDPDLALGRVRLIGESDGRKLLRRELLSKEHQGRWVGKTTLRPDRLGLRPGDVLQYWVEVADNRTPKPNLYQTARREIIVVAPSEPEAEQGESGGQSGAGSPDSNEGDPSQDQQGQEGTNSGSQQNGESGERSEQGEQGQNSEQQPGQGGEQQQQDEPSGNAPQNGLKGPGGEGGESNEDQQQGGYAANSDNSSDSEQQSSPQGGQQGGEEGQQGQQEERPVARDGSDDGAAFDRIREHFENQENRGQSQGDRSQDPADRQDNQSDGERGDRSASEDSQPGAEDTGEGQRDSDSQTPDRDASDSPPQAGEEPGAQSDSRSSDPGGEADPGKPTDPEAGPRQGTGDSGENEAADQGGGQSDDRGAGESSGQRGEQQDSDRPTGQQGERAGEGTSSRESSEGNQRDQQGGQQEGPSGAGDDSQPGEQGESGGDQSGQDRSGEPSNGERSDRGANQDGQRRGRPSGDPGDDAGEQATGENSDSKRPDRDAQRRDPNDQRRDQREPSDAKNQPGRPGDPTRGGEKPGGQREFDGAAAGEQAEPGGDEANLDYAREQTELVLDRLEEQLAKKEVDSSLLEKLGWSEEDLKRLVSRWRERERQAAQEDPNGQSQLDDALRSLGLRPEGPTNRTRATKDNFRDLRERVRPEVPPQFREAVELYNRNLSRAKQEEP